MREATAGQTTKTQIANPIMTIKQINVPDIGDFDDVEVIDVLVSPGDTIDKEDSLISLESDKATMEVPSTHSGTVKEVKVKVGDKVSEGSPILTLEVAQEAEQTSNTQPTDSASTEAGKKQAPQQPESTPSSRPAPSTNADMHAEVLVLGAGPGGYTAAFRAADLGKRVILVERYPRLGGVCLNVGCIPSKALLHVAQVIDETRDMKQWGVDFGGAPKIDKDKLVNWKNSVVERLTGGLEGLAEKRGVQVVQGKGQFISPGELAVETGNGNKTISFDSAIIAAGSQATKLPQLPDDDPRILDSTSALELPAITGDLLVVGGGIIALEMATVYHALGVNVSVAVRSGTLLSGLDKELVAPLRKRISKLYDDIHFHTEVDKVETGNKGITVHFKGEGAPEPKRFDYILVAVGRRSNGDKIGCDKAGIHVNEKGFIAVDKQMRTNVSHIFAIGDIVGDPQLAHKASHEGKVAAEVAAGLKSAFDAKVIPSVAYTDPEVAWVGLTEPEAKSQGLNYGKGVFPWSASGRSLSLGRDEGLTKLLFDKDSGRLIGMGVVGPNAGELIAEGTLAIEMGADAQDIGLTIHPHPTLSESVMMAAEAFEGTITDLYLPKKD
jgi:dihydrolipoamide dehydrogenase